MPKSMLGKVITFEWDEANLKHLVKHNVTPAEAEDVFFDKNNVLDDDIEHSVTEKRYLIVGKTLEGRLLYQIFTRRDNKIRVISSRDINRKEVYLYEKKVSSSKVQK